ncbi:DUF485 domain-containing protein [Cryobacterium sp. TMT1-21]|uniref:DUF485 domain-containing protein n=1 Tax=Cryobacterium shii TaxID=1259235 RepID=A0AAQ2HEK4_9MICO|nr:MULTISPECIES: DUF485 domain-containing protein [Cryobacterium]TFC42479.1 DUF485 domain-containing protein [Cryobacterium shii]TFC80811.1 DUF485 domain-containing protein [Cryobacterium sp. TmT2-59]TFD13261.1 DUF485 domain-containing protein [Cryobacterium sp. TMT1-21]TFD18682.1 DUF485 domain-containing protein [Cryobacterium sp. TMT4-10]TFD28484.1 DUF485 domain-containing protein [Cryobacterium sp. TMT2-23]
MTESLKDARPDGAASTIDYVAYEKTPRFLELKRQRRRFVLPLAAFFFIWYFVFVLVAAYLPGVMAIPVFGRFNLGLVLGLGQFVTTFGITMWYVSYSNRRLDPLGAELRAELEGMDKK